MSFLCRQLALPQASLLDAPSGRVGQVDPGHSATTLIERSAVVTLCRLGVTGPKLLFAPIDGVVESMDIDRVSVAVESVAVVVGGDEL